MTQDLEAALKEYNRRVLEMQIEVINSSELKKLSSKFLNLATARADLNKEYDKFLKERDNG